MSASAIVGPSPLRPWRWALYIASPVLVLAATCWWLTAPLEEPSPEQAARADASAAAALPSTPGTPGNCPRPVSWPEERLEGAPAKTLLLAVLQDADARLDQVECYTATFRKQERIRGVLGPEQTLSMKVRQHPFAIYFKFLSPSAGKEVVYAEGHHDNKVIA